MQAFLVLKAYLYQNAKKEVWNNGEVKHPEHASDVAWLNSALKFI